MEVGLAAGLRSDSLQISLLNHADELAAIERKLENQMVPAGKREKLLYRYNLIKVTIIPRINNQLEGIS